MTKFIIITGTQNSGKTTTAGMVFHDLRQYADGKDGVFLTDADGKVLPVDHPLVENGKPMDFIANLKVEGKKVVIVSLGDFPQYLKSQIETYLNKVAYFVCCLRTHNREGSTRRMLFEDYADYPKEEFRTEYSVEKTQMFNVKETVVERIIETIITN